MQSRLANFSTIVFTAVFLLLVVPGYSNGVQPAAFLGRWDITIASTGDTFRSSWLEVAESDGKLSGKLLWRWGSVTPVKSVEVIGEELRVTRTESYEDKPVDVVYAGKLVDGKLVGSVKNPDGSVFQWTGIRAIEKVDVSGTWQLTLETPRRKATTASLVLSQDGSNVTGRYIRARGQEFPVEKGKLDGTKLTFSVTFPLRRRALPGTTQQQEGTGASWHYAADIHGDRVSGTVRGEAGGAVASFSGQRHRKWGEPVQVFNGKSLTGWGARDPNREFHWSVRDGAMVNRPPDQDIVSEKQFQDFKLHVEFSLARGSNSGIYLRGRYELQLLDDFGRPPGVHSNCSIYSRLAPSANASKRADEWQTLEATLVGRWLTVVLNGQTVMDNVHLDGITGGAIIPKGASFNDETLPGPLMFQGDHGLVRFRKIEVTPAVE